MADNSKIIAGGSIAVGVLLLWSAINNRKVLDTARNVVAGQKPIPGPPVIPGGNVPFNTGGSYAGGTASVGGAAGDALQYDGTPYSWGGAPGTNPKVKGIGPHDCSSLANWVHGHDLDLPIPGYAPGTYDGSSHGPPTGVWLLWGGLGTVGHSGAVAQPGDVCVWQTHMGIALGGGQMISAQDPENGTQVSGIDGFIPGEVLFIRRYKSAATISVPTG